MTLFFKTALLLAPLTLMACEPAPPIQDPANAMIFTPVKGDCIAEKYQDLVGQKDPAISIPAGVDYRQYRTGDPITMDMRPARVNFEYDKSGKLLKVSCG